VVHGWSRAATDDFEGGVAQMREGLALYDATGSRVAQPLFHGLLAETLLSRGRDHEASEHVQRGLALAARNGERISEIDLHRLNGELAARAGRVDDAVAILRRAILVARELGARTPALRAATALHRLLVQQGFLNEIVTSPLPDLIASFDGDLDTPDLRDARLVV